MTDIDWEQLEADREAGTKGPFKAVSAKGPHDEHCYWTIDPVADEDWRGSLFSAHSAEHIGGISKDESAANASRAARLDVIEAYALQAKRQLEAADRMVEVLQSIIGQSGYVSADGFSERHETDASKRARAAVAAYEATKGGDA